MHEHVEAWRQAVEAGAQRLAQAAPDAIADDGIADAAAHRDADPRAAELIGRDVQHQRGCGQPRARCPRSRAKSAGVRRRWSRFTTASRWRGPRGACD